MLARCRTKEGAFLQTKARGNVNHHHVFKAISHCLSNYTVHRQTHQFYVLFFVRGTYSFMCMNVCPHVHMQTTCMPGALEGQKRVSDFLGTRVTDCCETLWGCWEPPWVLCKSIQCAYPGPSLKSPILLSIICSSSVFLTNIHRKRQELIEGALLAIWKTRNNLYLLPVFAVSVIVCK